MAQIINGKEISQTIKDELKAEVTDLKAQGVSVTLAVIQVGNDPASSVYVRNKKMHVHISVSNLWLMNCLRTRQKKHYLV